MDARLSTPSMMTDGGDPDKPHPVPRAARRLDDLIDALDGADFAHDASASTRLYGAKGLLSQLGIGVAP